MNCYNMLAATVMDCIAEIGMDPQGVQKCVEVNILMNAKTKFLIVYDS